MSDAAPHAAITEFVTAHAAAWSSGDVDAVADALGLPQMLARSDGTTFIEDDRQLVVWIEERLGDWAARGVDRVTVAVEAVEDLPDSAARVTSRWQLHDAEDAVLMAFVAVDTLACDEGDWYYVVTDLAGEDSAVASGHA